ncbi:hypothetical protein PRIPAC_76516 [Pristionchus pacificus]|uniref:Uncharacterized protein n=1 Tax=Pristionchus pacificus TaxID=54126 RepID=A0A2A6CSR7_PRIPA|nr:hypothetical protein PRIPAC_76516 [Pristionchus pacificus]|eukprot:PDM81264.1 hypothetical protein PRIPAC_36267 [Pristionchus pacificus]
MSQFLPSFYLQSSSILVVVLPSVFNAITYPKEWSIDQVITVDEEELHIVPPTQRKPHPEELDENDLPLFYRGLNPDKSRKLRSSYRLADWIRPIEYDVTLNVGVRGHNGAENSTVKGFAKIVFNVEGDATNLL